MDLSEADLSIQPDAARQNRAIPEVDYADQLAYWSQVLAAVPPALEMPIDHPRLMAHASKHAQYLFALPSWLCERLEILAREEGVTTYIVLLAAFQTLLYRYTSQDDLVVATCYAQRQISDFANIITLRTSMLGNPGFRELLGRVRTTLLQAEAYGDVPFEQLLEALQQEGNLSSSALLQVVFAFGTSLSQKLEPGEFDRFLIEENNWRAKCELALIAQEIEQGVSGWLEYQSSLFEVETIERLLTHWQVLLEGIVADPTQRLSDLPIMTASEIQKVLVEWNDTALNYTTDTCIHRLFEAQVERSPDTLAVVYQDSGLTYRELNRRANQLAQYLQKRGVGPEVLVGLCVERSLWMIVGVLGILKAGGAYIPLDPTYPPDRLSFMLADAEVPVLLTEERLIANVPKQRMEVIFLDKDWDKISLEPVDNPETGVGAENAAYVIYTSGSTGTPKGVVIEHRSLVNYAAFAGAAYDLKPADRVLQFASLSFDTSAEEIYPCLLKGATLVLRTNSMPDSVTLFLERCQHWAITVLDLPTAYWHELARKIDAEGITLPSSLRLVIIGGERASPERLASWQKRVRQSVQLVNTYGPTEATIVATIYTVPETVEVGAPLREVPIGRPVSNVQTYLLDRYLNPVPIGVPAELYIAGIGLAREYLNRPTLTAQKFIPHPFNPEPGARLYKTGDRVRYLPTGDIEFLGRFDEQVKIRGYRIELGEIETVLGRHPDVREAVVVAREDASGDKQLVAYVVPRHEQRLTSSDLRRFMQELLPDYMVPAVFVLLETIPMSPSGKVDRRGLPVPEQTRPELSEYFVAPTLAVHRQLVQIWEELLDVRPIGIQDNFFDLGGHSLLAVRLIDQIEQVCGKKISAATLLAGATIEELANVIMQPEAGTASTQVGTVHDSSPKRSSTPRDMPRFSVKSALAKFLGKRGN